MSLRDKSGNVLAASDSSTRFPACASRPSDHQHRASTLLNEHTLIVTGRQSGKIP